MTIHDVFSCSTKIYIYIYIYVIDISIGIYYGIWDNVIFRADSCQFFMGSGDF